MFQDTTVVQHAIKRSHASKLKVAIGWKHLLRLAHERYKHDPGNDPDQQKILTDLQRFFNRFGTQDTISSAKEPLVQRNDMLFPMGNELGGMRCDTYIAAHLQNPKFKKIFAPIIARYILSDSTGWLTVAIPHTQQRVGRLVQNHDGTFKEIT